MMNLLKQEIYRLQLKSTQKNGAINCPLHTHIAFKQINHNSINKFRKIRDEISA